MSSFKLHKVRKIDAPQGALSYLLHEPPGFATEPRPLVLFLHGAGERGDDLRLVTTHAIPALIEQGTNVPFVAISPQCPVNRAWAELTGSLEHLLDHLDGELRIDPRRVYLTGISMGAYGAWKLAAQAPQRFAALVPVCGAGEDDWAPALASLPSWVFHGARDQVVPAQASRRMVTALKRVGAPVQLTIYDDLGHDCWRRVYTDPALYDWLLAQRRPG